MFVALFGVAQKQLHDGVVVGRYIPLPQNLLPVGVGKGRPALTDIAGADTQSIRRQHHIFCGNRAVVHGEQEILRCEQGDHGGGIIKSICQLGVICNAGLLTGNKARCRCHAGVGVCPLDLAKPLIDLFVLTDGEDHTLPSARAGRI